MIGHGQQAIDGRILLIMTMCFLMMMTAIGCWAMMHHWFVLHDDDADGDDDDVTRMMRMLMPQPMPA